MGEIAYYFGYSLPFVGIGLIAASISRSWKKGLAIGSIALLVVAIIQTLK